MSEEMTTQVSDSKYIPTPAELRILEVLANPENTGKSVTDKCELANVSRTCFYETLKRAEFINLLKDTAVDLVKEKLLDIIAATIKYATSSPQNHQDRKILLEMAGMYIDKETAGNVIMIKID